KTHGQSSGPSSFLIHVSDDDPTRIEPRLLHLLHQVQLGCRTEQDARPILIEAHEHPGVLEQFFRREFLEILGHDGVIDPHPIIACWLTHGTIPLSPLAIVTSADYLYQRKLPAFTGSQFVPSESFFRLDRRTALVTGGGRGIGEAICQRLASAGARVVVFDLSADNAAGVAGTIGGLAVAGDVASETDIAKALAEAERSFGP